MNLETYLKTQRHKQKNIAEKVNCTPASISALIKGKKNASADMMRNIAIATNYQVMPNDMVFPNGTPEQKDWK